MAYMTDTAPFAKPGEGVHAGQQATAAERRIIEFLAGCDLVIYDTMYEREQYMERMTWGHTYPEYAHSVCRAAGVGHLVLFHHLPDATDADLDERQQRWELVENPSASLAGKEEPCLSRGSCTDNCRAHPGREHDDPVGAHRLVADSAADEAMASNHLVGCRPRDTCSGGCFERGY